jgi:hypothetical protein
LLAAQEVLIAAHPGHDGGVVATSAVQLGVLSLSTSSSSSSPQQRKKPFHYYYVTRQLLAHSQTVICIS